MDAEKKRLRDEVSELTATVRALRDELAAEHLARAAHDCHCVHPVWVPNVVYPPYYPAIYTVSVGSGGYVQTNAPGGAAGAVTTHAIESN